MEFQKVTKQRFVSWGLGEPKHGGGAELGGKLLTCSVGEFFLSHQLSPRRTNVLLFGPVKALWILQQGQFWLCSERFQKKFWSAEY